MDHTYLPNLIHNPFTLNPFHPYISKPNKQKPNYKPNKHPAYLPRVKPHGQTHPSPSPSHTAIPPPLCKTTTTCPPPFHLTTYFSLTHLPPHNIAYHVFNASPPLFPPLPLFLHQFSNLANKTSHPYPFHLYNTPMCINCKIPATSYL